MKVWVVVLKARKSEYDTELVGVFTTEAGADAAMSGPGTYLFGEIDLDRAYRGQNFNVQVRRVIGPLDLPPIPTMQ